MWRYVSDYDPDDPSNRTRYEVIALEAPKVGAKTVKALCLAYHAHGRPDRPVVIDIPVDRIIRDRPPLVMGDRAWVADAALDYLEKINYWKHTKRK